MNANISNLPQKTEMLELALSYAGDSFPIFPCDPATKKPLSIHGFLDATTNEEQIRQWWANNPDAMVGWPTKGFCVLDVDLPQGPDSLKALETEQGEPLPKTMTVQTPSGGTHFIFQTSEEVKNTASGIGVDLDIRGDGGYIILAGSVNVEGKAYKTIVDLPPAPAPAKLIRMANSCKSGEAKRVKKKPEASRPTSGDSSPYGRAALEREYQAVGTAPEGTRNQLLNEAAFSLGTLIAGEELQEGEVVAALTIASIQAGLSRTEADKTIRSGLDAGKLSPRQAPKTHFTAEDLRDNPAPDQQGKEPFDLNSFSLNGQSTDMEKKMLDDKFVLGRMALLGQSTIFYAKPNAGKTLLVLWLVCNAIKRGELDGAKVFYINADDTHKGLVHKLKLAEARGFKMLAPGYEGFKSNDLPIYLNKMIQTGTASGKVLILDTVKKFTDLMKKDKASQFGETIRQFISHGGTVIMLAHVNKHRDDDQKVVFGGTSDLVDDADCAYTLDIVNEDPATGVRTVAFENFKSRGDSVREAFYRYNYADGTTYHERFESVVALSEEERLEAEKAKRFAALLERNQTAINFIKDCIRESFNQKTALIKEASDRSGLSKKKITQVLQDHTGSNPSENQFWHVVIGEKNAHTYELNYGVL